MLNQVLLSDGTVIEFAYYSTNTSGFNHVTTSSAWSEAEFAPFITEVHWPSDEVRAQSKKRGLDSWQIKKFADPREAAYIAARFIEDPIGTENEVLSGNIVYPEDLYKIELKVDIAAMKKEHEEKILARKEAKARQVKGREYIIEKFTYGLIKELSKKFGRDMIIHDLDNLTVGEFSTRYGI